MPFDFSGKTAIVTGGASGIGRATADLLRSSGAEVTVIDRETDVTNRAALARAFEGARSRCDASSTEISSAVAPSSDHRRSSLIVIDYWPEQAEAITLTVVA